MRVGIDLGTTYCVIAYVDPATGNAVVIKNKLGSPVTPSVLFFEPDGTILHGDEAKVYVEEGSEQTASYFKYHMEDPLYFIERNGQKYTAVDLSAELLRALVHEAEQVIGEQIREAVITVPAYFTHVGREATMEAGRRAGLHVLNVINEPTAAAFAYGIKGRGVPQKLLFYDLGGGTFDVTIACVTDDEIKVLGSDGNHRLGGKDWDDALADHFANLFKEEFGVDLTKDPEMNTTLQALAENTKKQLTEKQKHKVLIKYEGCRGEYEITRETFEDVTKSRLNITKDVIHNLMNELSMSWEDIDGVVLVGGSTRMPQVQDYLTKMCKKPPMRGVNVDEAVALGAAIRANIDTDGNLKIGGNYGQTMYIPGAKKIRDATAHSMGMIAVSKDETRYVNSIIIPKNSVIPSTITSPYELAVAANAENRLEVYMLQGEEAELTYPLNCSIVGKYVFTGFQVKHQRQVTVDVTYAYDENNLVQVSAVQRDCGKDLDLHIEPVDDDMSWVLNDPRARLQTASGLQDMAVYIAIDLSGSMTGTPLEEAKKSAIGFVKEFDLSRVEVGIINFSDRVKLYQQLGSNENELIRKINGWKINGDFLGYGNLGQPFTLAGKEFSGVNAGMKYLVVLTDGCWAYEEKAIQEAEKLHQMGIEVIAVGFGTAKRDFLRKIASREDFASMTNIADLRATLTGIARIM